MVVVAVVMVTIAMTSHLSLKNQSRHPLAIVVMMRHHSVQQDNRTRHRDHYFSNQMPHITSFTTETSAINAPSPMLQRYK